MLGSPLGSALDSESGSGGSGLYKSGQGLDSQQKSREEIRQRRSRFASRSSDGG
jgi:hypothetical protein